MEQVINYDKSKAAAKVLRAVNHKLRQQILKLIMENQRMNVTEIYVKLRLEQSVTSQHLAILRGAGVVKSEQSGKERYYSVDKVTINRIGRIVEDFVTDKSCPK